MHFASDDADSGLISVQFLLERVTFKPDIMSKIEGLFSKPFEVAYLRRQCEEHGQINTDRTAVYSKTMTSNDEGLLRYLFCVFKTSADDTAQTNYQLCSHSNIQNITVRYAGNQYPHLPQNADWSRNSFIKFYKDFVEISRSLGFRNTGLSMNEFRDLYTLYSIDCSAQPIVSPSSTVTISIERREVPADANASLQNPRSIRGYFIFISECRLEIDCLKKAIRKL
jgi:hypothetical protein